MTTAFPFKMAKFWQKSLLGITGIF